MEEDTEDVEDGLPVDVLGEDAGQGHRDHRAQVHPWTELALWRQDGEWRD